MRESKCIKSKAVENNKRKGWLLKEKQPFVTLSFLPLLLFETLTFSCLCFCLLLARLHFLALLLVDIEGGVDPAASANSSQTVMKAADLPVTTCHTNNI